MPAPDTLRSLQERRTGLSLCLLPSAYGDQATQGTRQSESLPVEQATRAIPRAGMLPTLSAAVGQAFQHHVPSVLQTQITCRAFWYIPLCFVSI